MKNFISLILILLAPIIGMAQTCNPYFSFKEDVKATYEYYNGKNKLVSKTKNYFKSVSGSGNNVAGTMITEIIDVKKNTILSSSESKWRCENGVVQFYMNTMNIEGADMSNTAMDVTINGDEMDIPANLEPGQTLKDVNYHVVMKVSGLTMMDRTFIVKDRKVEAKETVTTPAGSFESIKLTYTTESVGKSGGTSKPLPTSIWYAPDVGLVKMESYRDGKVYSSQLLANLEK